VKRAAICVSPEGLEVDATVETALRDAGRRLEDAGWQLVEVEAPPMREAMRLQLLLWMSEYAYNRGEAVAREDDPDASFVYAQLLKHAPTPTMESLMEALQQRIALARQWQQFLAEYPVLLCPISAEPPFADQLDVESAASFHRVVEAQLTQIALPLMGMPAISVSTAGDPRAPMGVQLVAARFREDLLFDAAAEIERRGSAVEISDPD
jgi:amidase